MNEIYLESNLEATNINIAEKEYNELNLSHRARYLSFKHRTKVEFLKFFIV